jgi:hypothetical protein
MSLNAPRNRLQPQAYMQGVTTRSHGRPPHLPHHQDMCHQSGHLCLIEVEHQIGSGEGGRQYMYHESLCEVMWTIHKDSSGNVSVYERGDSCIVLLSVSLQGSLV